MTTPQKSPLGSFSKILISIVFLILIVIGSLNLIKSKFAHSPMDGRVDIALGNVLPDFTLTRMDGSTFKLSEFFKNHKNGVKVVLINFWASWCEACIQEMPSLVRLRNAHVQEGFEIIGINLDENPDAVVSGIVRQFGIQFPVCKDTEGKIADLFDVHAIPMTVVVNQNRKILYLKDGDQNWDAPAVHAEVKRWLTE